MSSVSKQHAVIPSQVFELDDGSSSYKDFAMTRNNRFSSAGQASKNIIQPPSAVLHYYNVPPCISQEQLLRVATSHLLMRYGSCGGGTSGRVGLASPLGAGVRRVTGLLLSTDNIARDRGRDLPAQARPIPASH